MGTKAKLSAAVLGLVLAGAPASVILDQFLNEKEGNSLKAYKDGSGIWTICRGATQAFNIDRFNQIAQTAARANAVAAGNSEKTIIKYREMLRHEKTCDLPVPADVASGLLEYANHLRANAMHADTSGTDSDDAGSTPASGMTYCQAVLWIEPLLATIEQGNNNFAGIREIEQQRQKSPSG